MRRNRRAVAWALGAFAFAQVALTAVLELPAARLRDPEYAERRERFRTRRERFPGRTSVAVFGSSRVTMGVRPTEPNADEPLLVNFGQVGAGPLLQRLALRRLLVDGPIPDAVLIEFWPPYVLDTPLECEEPRVLPARLRHADLAAFAGHFDADWRAARLAPWYGQRFLLMSQWFPVWLYGGQRFEHTWALIDATGWTTGSTTVPAQRAERVLAARTYYQPRLAVAAIRPASVAAYDDLLTDCRVAGVRAALVWLPESSEFRAAYPPATEVAARAFAADLVRRHGVPFVEARAWSADDDLTDAYHLSGDGARRFTARLHRDALPLVGAAAPP